MAWEWRKNTFLITLPDGTVDTVECAYLETGNSGELGVVDVAYYRDEKPEKTFRWWHIFTPLPSYVTAEPPFVKHQRIYASGAWIKATRAEAHHAPR